MINTEKNLPAGGGRRINSGKAYNGIFLVKIKGHGIFKLAEHLTVLHVVGIKNGVGARDGALFENIVHVGENRSVFALFSLEIGGEVFVVVACFDDGIVNLGIGHVYPPHRVGVLLEELIKACVYAVFVQHTVARIKTVKAVDLLLVFNALIDIVSDIKRRAKENGRRNEHDNTAENLLCAALLFFSFFAGAVFALLTGTGSF